MTTTIADDDRELAKLPVVKIQDVLLARLVAREEAARMGFAAQALTQIATAVSEITRNVVQHAGGMGQIRVFATVESGRTGIKIIVDDAGGGIADVDRAMVGVSPGAGIPGSRTLMDDFAIRSGSGTGVVVTMVKWLPAA